MASISGFKLIPICFDTTVKSPHFLYVKKHTHQKSSLVTPADRTVFVVNVPPYCNEKGLSNLLGHFGPIESVFIQPSPGQLEGKKEQSLLNFDKPEKLRFQVAYVVFRSPSTVTKLMNSENFEEKLISTEKKPVKTGITKWCFEYKKSYPNADLLQKEIDKYMLDFDVRKEKEKELERLQGEPDEEGWTMVTHGNKKMGVTQERVTKKEKKKKKEKELVNFYNFQQRESKREHIASLRKKFEEDKRRIEVMRSSRRFKPF